MASELAALIAWPIGDPQVPGIARGSALSLPAPMSVAREGGVIVGDSNFPGDERPIAVTATQSAKHFHVVGRTGSGKSTFAMNAAAKIMADGRGLIYFDPKGQDAPKVLNLVPPERISDVIYFNAADVFRPMGFNLFGQGSPQIVASNIQHIFDHIYGSTSATGASRLPETIYYAVLTLMTTKAGNGKFTFVDIMPLLWPRTAQERAFSAAVIKGVTDSDIRAWWKDLDRMGDTERNRYFQALRSRIWQLNGRSDLRYVIGQQEGGFDMRDVIANRKILVVNFQGLPEETLQLVGSMIVNNAWAAASEGLSSEDNPMTVMLDEFHHFTHSPISMETMTAEGRSKGMSFWFLHQGLDQLEGRKSLKAAIMNNAVNKFVMQRGSYDANEFANEFGPPVKADDFKRLGAYEFYARVATESEGISPVISGVFRPPAAPLGTGPPVIEASRQRYGRTIPDIEREIQRRRTLGHEDRFGEAQIGDEDMPS